MILVHNGIQFETDKEILFIFEDNPVWVPKSIIEYFDYSEIDIPIWFVRQHNLVDYERSQL